MNLKTYLRIKQAGKVGDWVNSHVVYPVEDAVLRPAYDAVVGPGAYNEDKFNRMSVRSTRNRNTDQYDGHYEPYSEYYHNNRNNPNLNKDMLRRFDHYRNNAYRIDRPRYTDEFGSPTVYFNVPKGGERYIPPEYRSVIVEAEGAVPKTNEGAPNVTSRKYDPKYKKPRRMQSRKHGKD